MFGMSSAAPLSKAVERLVYAHSHTDGTRSGTEEALLLTLQRAVASTGGKGSASGVSRTGSPVDLGALDLLDEITSVIHAAVPWTRKLPLTRRLILWTQAVAGGPDEWALLEYCDTWERAIRRHLEPPKEIPLKGVACPECKRDSIVVTDADGEHITRPILIAYASESPVRVECVVCQENWQGNSVELLAGSVEVG